MPASPGNKVVNLIQTPTIPVPKLEQRWALPGPPLRTPSAGLGHCSGYVRAPFLLATAMASEDSSVVRTISGNGKFELAERGREHERALRLHPRANEPISQRRYRRCKLGFAV